MSGKNTTVQVIKINAQAENLAKALTALKKDFQGLVVPPELDKIITKLENSIAAVQRKTEKGIVPREVFLESEKEIGKIKTAFDNLHNTMNSFKDLSDKKLFSMLPEGVKQKLDEINKAYEEYEDTLTGILKIEREVEAATEKRISAQQKLEAAERSRDSKQTTLATANQELAKYQDVTNAIKEQVAAAKELEKAENALANAKKSGKSEKSIATRQARVDSAKQREIEAKSVVDAIDPNQLKRQEAALRAAIQAEKEYSAAKREVTAEERAKTQAEVAEANALERLQEARRQSQVESSKEAAALEKMKKALAEVAPKYKSLVLEGKNTSEQLANLRSIISQLNDKELNKLKKSLSASGEAFGSFGEEVDGLKRALTDVKEETKANDEAFAQKEAFENKIKQFLGLSGAAQVLRASLRDAMQTITELDATMTEMAVVTDLTVGDYWDQLPEYSKRASELGVSINDAYKSATLYYQQGLKTNEVNAISVETLKMAKIANMDAADATDKMTAALRGFNMELNEASASRVSDVYSELAAITAADTKEIANAMTKTASIAHSAGMEFETTAAFLAQIVETTRESAVTAGTAMKTVIARFQELKKSPDEIGEIDGEIVDANAIESALRSVGVSLRDSSGQFRDLDDVFLELSSKWDTLDKNTQRYIATIAAGSRQQSRFIAMMSDYGRTQELVDAANSSAGASNQQFEKTMESLSAKLEKLKNAWHEFTMGIVDSDLVKTGVDILTKFLEIINKATSSFGSMGNAITKIIGTLAIFKLGRKIFDQFSGPISDLFSKIAEDASKKGYLAGRNWATGAKQGGQDVVEGKEQAIPAEGEKEKTGFFGVQAFKRAGALQQEKIAMQNVLSNPEYTGAKKKLQELESKYTFEKTGRVYTRGPGGKQLKKDDPEAVKAKAEYDALIKKAREYENATKNIGKVSEKQWKAVGEGISAVGSSLTGVGTATAMIGGVISSIGLEDLGEAISGIGQGVMILGTAISAIPPLLTLISSHPIIALITILLGIALAAILEVLKEIAKNTPEGKLKAAQENAEKAAEAADKLTNSYQNLNKSINDLDDKYKALDDLTRGTEEWNKAVQEINDSVLELIEEYPQLAEFMENKDGVLTLALDDEGLQNVIIQAKTAAIVAQNTSKAANAQVATANAQVATINATKTKYKEAFQEAGGWSIDSGDGSVLGWINGIISWPLEILGRSAKALADKIVSDSVAQIGAGQEEKYAEALASGVLVKNEQGIYSIAKGMEAQAKELLGTTEITIEVQTYLKEFGDELRALGKEIKSYNNVLNTEYEAIANNTKQLMDFSNLSQPAQEEAKAYVDNLLTGEDYKKIYESELAGIGSLDKADIMELLQATYGQGTTYDSEKQEIRDSQGQVLASGVTEDHLKNLEANRRATERFKKSGEAMPSTIEAIKDLLPSESGSAIERLFSDSGGLDLLVEDFSGKTFSEQEIERIWSGLTQAQRDAFGGESSGLLEYINTALAQSREEFRLATGRLTEAGYWKEIAFEKTTAGQSKNLSELAVTIGKSDNFDFVAAFNEQINKLPKELQPIFARELAAVNETPYNREKWEGLLDAFSDYDIPVSEDLNNFIMSAMSEVNASYSDNWLKAMGVSESLITHYRVAIEREDTDTISQFHSTFQKWRKNWELANNESAKAQHDLIIQVAEKLIENFEKQIEGQENLINAVNEGNDNLLNKMQQSIDEDRQARESEKMETDIQDKYSELAYLQQDTSGANALGVLALQEEITNTEQDYQDTLVDQKLQEFADANAMAAEQRERQIELLQLQLEQFREKDVYQIAKEVVQTAMAQLKAGIPVDESALGAIFKETIFASSWKEADFWTNISEALAKIVENNEKENSSQILQKHLDSTQTLIDNNNLTADSEQVKGGYTSYKESMEKAGLGKQAISENEFIDQLQFSGSSGSTGLAGIFDSAKARAIKKKGNFTYDDFNDLREEYRNAGGPVDWFDSQIQNLRTTGAVKRVVTAQGVSNKSDDVHTDREGQGYGDNGRTTDVMSVKLGEDKPHKKVEFRNGGKDVSKETKEYLDTHFPKDDRKIVAYNGEVYMYRSATDSWNQLKGPDSFRQDYLDLVKKEYKGFKTGGLASFTGPAWLDGTPSKPEYVLNATQTERFFSLIDVLESFNKNDPTPVKSGDNYFDIEINVEKLENDYDVEQVANKIRSMIYEDASYRNVNAINLIR